MNDGAYVANIDEYESIGTYWIAIYVNGDNVTYSKWAYSKRNQKIL